MGRRWGIAIAATGLAIAAGSSAPSAGAASHEFLAATDGLSTRTTIALAKGSEPELLHRVVLTGKVPAPGTNQWVTVTVNLRGKELVSRQVLSDPATGRYRTRLRLKGCCSYLAQARSGSEVSAPVSFEATGPADLDDGPDARHFNELLEENGFHMGDEITNEYDESTALGIMALRKVHDLDRTEEYTPDLFELLLSGDAEFEPEHTEDGRHVEVDISRQVMALVEDGQATDVFHVSTGAGGTPTGEFSFYSYGPGYNAKGMYYSIYYDGNYATHGFSSVPTYPASHGCTRNPIPYSTYIYDWIDLGDAMYVYE